MDQDNQSLNENKDLQDQAPKSSNPEASAPQASSIDNQTTQIPQKDFTPPKQKTSKGWLKLIIVLLIVLFVAVAAWWLFIKKDKSNTATAPTTNNSSHVTNTFTPDNVVYAFKSKDTDPFSLYIRPAVGGNRTSAKTLSASESITGSDVSGQNVVVATDKAIYVSKDSGVSYNSVLTLNTGEQVTDIKFSSDGKNIIYGDLASVGGQNKVTSIDLDGKNSKILFTSTKPGVILIGYNADKSEVIYREGCWNCDGFDGLPLLRDLKTNKIINLTKDIKAIELTDSSVNNDFTKLIYAKSTNDPNAAGGNFVGEFTGAPYSINLVDLSGFKTSQIDTFGTKGEKNANGTLRMRIVHVGFVADTDTPYYTNDSQLFIAKSDSPSMAYEAAKPIFYAPFVGNNQIITGSGADTSNYTLSSYDTSSKKLTTIFSGDNNTLIFGVTTK